MTARVLIAGGGTGGHLFPALAVAEALRERGAEILFVGTKAGMEAKIAPQRGFALEFIPVTGFRRKRILANLSFPFQVITSFIQSLRIIRRFQPQAALGTGGYVCGPVLLAAFICGVPMILQEQNSYPGVTTRLLARFARRVFLNFAEAARHLPPRSHWQHVGNPVRSGFALLEKKEAMQRWNLNPELPTLLVFGGSQGAMSLNRATAQALPDLGQFCNLIWGRGARDTSEVAGWTGPGRLVVKSFIDDMPAAYAASDLAICRSGAMTLSELQAAALPAILVPFPYAAANHQKHNALAYAKSGGALVIEDREWDGQRLLTVVKDLLGNRERLGQMREALAKQPEQDAARVIAEEALRFAV